MSKVKIAHTYKGDLSIIQQQIEQAMKKTMAQLEQQQANNPASNFKQLKSIIERRLQQFFLNATTKARGIVQYSKNPEKDLQKVIMQPDQNLQKINQVKTSMLRQSILKEERQRWPEMKYRIQASQPKTLNVVHFEGFKQNINESLRKNFEKVPDVSPQLQKIRNFEDVIIQAVAKIQNQQREDSQFLNLK